MGSSHGDRRPSRRCRAPDRDCPDEQRLPIRMGPVLKSPANVKPPWDWKGRLGNQAAFSIASQFTSTGGQQGPVYHGWKAATTTPRQPQGPTGRAAGQSCRGGRPASGNYSSMAGATSRNGPGSATLAHDAGTPWFPRPRPRPSNSAPAPWRWFADWSCGSFLAIGAERPVDFLDPFN